MLTYLASWFARPPLLGALAIVPLLAVLVFFAHRARRRALARLSNAAGADQPARLRPRLWRTGFVLLGLLILAIACAGPQWGRDLHQGRTPVADLAIVLDLSRSMSAEQPSRRERALRALRDLADDLQSQGGCRVALVAFAGRPRLLFPLTRDYGHFRSTLAQIEADDIPSLRPDSDEPLVSGTRIGAALQLAVQAVTADGSGRRALLLLSDGDDPAGDREWLEGAQAARAAHVPVHTIGFGDPDAAHTIPAPAGVLHFGKEVVHSRLDEEVLREIARRGGGTYLPARLSALPLGTLVSALLTQTPREGTADNVGRPVPAQRYAWFLIPALILLILTMLVGDGVRWRARLRQATLAGLFMAPLSAAPPAEEANALVRAGNEAFARQEYEEALVHYAGAEERSQDPGLLAFNSAAAYYRLGRYREAELHYRRCLEDDEVPAGRRALALFGRGNALVRQAGEQDAAPLAQAVAAYRACLAERAAPPDLRADARFNLEWAQLLWLKARARTPDRPGGAEPQPRPDKKQSNSGDEEPSDSALGEEGRGQSKSEHKELGTRAQGSRKSAAGPLQALPDNDRLVPLAADEVEAHLRRLAERIAGERRHYYQSRPHADSTKDW
jgi:Ca-activated chloride channel homolog